ncbi:hypothetical protein [Krasilnikovia sp. M28-CT-15]|uniref:hypothetical protein n=1 Tax=Krasilnikovia sp. M28-CT-15 TaxID=3373540 RepID=UPI003876A4DD
MRSRLLGGLGVAVVLATAMAGCTKDQPGGVAPPPQPTTSFAFPVPPVTHRWQPDGLVCPTLSGSAAQGGGLTGPGKRVRGTDSRNGSLLYCQWGPDDETAGSAELQVSTSKRQESADAAWKVVAAPGLFDNPLPGVGEQAFVGPDTGNQFHVIVRSGNAILDITLKAVTSDAAALKALHDAAPGIATEMLGVLVPA